MRRGTSRLLVAWLCGVAAFAPSLAGAQESDEGAPAAIAIGAAPTNGVSQFGNAPALGSPSTPDLAAPLVAIASRPTGDGYWLAASDGGVFSYGSAAFHGSMGGVALNAPVVGIASSPTGDGYWLVAADGGVFSFGDAAFHGSMGGVALNAPVVGIASSPTGNGYWLAAADGGVFSFGDATFLGSAAQAGADHPIVGIARASGSGYWMVTRAGQVFPFGPPDFGSVEDFVTNPAKAPTSGIAAHGHDGYWLVHGVRSPLDRTSEGPSVRVAQARLDALGYWLGHVDGVFGPLTEQAVFAFQKVEALPVTGILDDATRTALASASRPLPVSASGDLVEIDKTRQLLFVVRDGQAQWTFNTSTGEEEPYTFEGEQYFSDTPTGRFSVIRQIDGIRVAPLGRLYRPKYFTTGGHAIHGYSHVPPQPASHGCVRVTNAAIDFIWSNDLAPLRSDVWVYGTSPS